MHDLPPQAPGFTKGELIMAKTVTVQLTDDIDGSCADETVAFSFDGVSYEIDLRSDNAMKLRAELTVWAQAGRLVEETVGGSGAVRLIRPYMDPTPGNVIRDWGRRNGHVVSARGRLPLHLVDAFEAAYRYQGSRAG